MSGGCPAYAGQPPGLNRAKEMKGSCPTKIFYMNAPEKMEVGEAPMLMGGRDDVAISIQSVGVRGFDPHFILAV